MQPKVGEIWVYNFQFGSGPTPVTVTAVTETQVGYRHSGHTISFTTHRSDFARNFRRPYHLEYLHAESR